MSYPDSSHDHAHGVDDGAAATDHVEDGKIRQRLLGVTNHVEDREIGNPLGNDRRIVNEQRRAAGLADKELGIPAADHQAAPIIGFEAGRDRPQRFQASSAFSAARSSLPLGPTGSRSFQT